MILLRHVNGKLSYGSRAMVGDTEMDIIEELQNYKRNLGFSNEEIAEKSGVPLSTVQKIFGGVTKSPRRKTLLALESFFTSSFSADVLKSMTGNRNTSYASSTETPDSSSVNESPAEYAAEKEIVAGDEMADPGWIIKQLPPGDHEYSGGVKLIFTRQGTYTIDDLEFLPDGVRVELIDGVLYQFNNPSVRHQTLTLEVATQLSPCAFDRNCMVFIAPLDVQLDCDNRTLLQPDIFALCDREKALEGGIYGAPEFVIEVLSKSTRHRDLTIKVGKYEHAGVREYWIIDPDNDCVLVYDFNDDNVIYHYTFDDKVPVRMSDGSCVIDFSEIKKRLEWFNK